MGRSGSIAAFLPRSAEGPVAGLVAGVWALQRGAPGQFRAAPQPALKSWPAAACPSPEQTEPSPWNPGGLKGPAVLVTEVDFWHRKIFPFPFKCGS